MPLFFSCKYRTDYDIIRDDINERPEAIRMMKKTVSAIMLFVVLALFFGCGAEKKEAPAVTGRFETEILNIGKADAILLYTENHTILIDTGSRGDGATILRALEERNISELDDLIITHFDQDHVGGAVKIINTIPVGKIYAPDYVGSCEEYDRFIRKTDELGYAIESPKTPVSLYLDDVLVSVYPPLKKEYKEADNNYSLVIEAIHGNHRFLFAGDAEEERLSELPRQMDLSHDFLKVPHHGIYHKMTESFLQSVRPTYAVITCGKNTLPDEETMKALSSLCQKTYLTKDGNVTAISDGKTITVTQEKITDKN